MTLRMEVRMDVGYNNILAFSLKSMGINISCCTGAITMHISECDRQFGLSTGIKYLIGCYPNKRQQSYTLVGRIYVAEL